MITPSQAAEVERVSLAIDEGQPIEPATVTGPPPVDNPILDALDLLHRTYPGERVDIWCSYREAGQLRYTGLVESFTPPDETCWSTSWLPSPQAVAEDLIARAGPRTRSARIAKRLAALQAEMAKLKTEEDALKAQKETA